jgi:hypothetical protein
VRRNRLVFNIITIKIIIINNINIVMVIIIIIIIVPSSSLSQLVLSHRLDTLQTCIAIQRNQLPAPNPAIVSVWICPVCEETSKHLRSFKGHIKRIYDWECMLQSESAREDFKKKACCLTDSRERHRNLVSRSGLETDTFRVRSLKFATDLWGHVQAQTPSSSPTPPSPHSTPFSFRR